VMNVAPVCNQVGHRYVPRQKPLVLHFGSTAEFMGEK
jgi:hypothetical protein